MSQNHSFFCYRHYSVYNNCYFIFADHVAAAAAADFDYIIVFVIEFTSTYALILEFRSVEPFRLLPRQWPLHFQQSSESRV